MQAQNTDAHVPRDAVYILLTKNGPTEADQLAAIRRRVPVPDAAPVYVDDLTVRRRSSDHHFPQRALAIKQMRKGDRLLVASPGRLGIGREDIRGVLHDLARGAHRVLDASTGLALLWTDEIADGLNFLDRGAIEHKADVLRAARAAKKAAGIVYRPQPKALTVAEEAAEVIWRDTVRYTRDEAGAACGVSWRTLHNRFGGRTEAMGHRPQTVKPRRRK